MCYTNCSKIDLQKRDVEISQGQSQSLSAVIIPGMQSETSIDLADGTCVRQVSFDLSK